MVPRSILFLAMAFAMILAVVADGSYGNDYGNKGNYGQGNKGNYGNNYRSPHYQALKISKYYSKGVIIGKVPALCDNYGAYWDKCAGDHYFQTYPIQPRSNNFYLRFTAFSGNSKGYNYNKNYYKSCSEARDNVAVEYKADGSDKWTTIAILKADHYRNPKTASYKICLYGDPCKVTFRFRSLEDCNYENNDYGVWSFADLKVVTYSHKYGDNYGDDRDDHDDYGDDRDDHYGGGYGDDYDDDDKHDDYYGGDRDDDDHHYGGGNYGNDKKGSYGDNRDCD
jgi:hypothetical protein